MGSKLLSIYIKKKWNLSDYVIGICYIWEFTYSICYSVFINTLLIHLSSLLPLISFFFFFFFFFFFIFFNFTLNYETHCKLILAVWIFLNRALTFVVDRLDPVLELSIIHSLYGVYGNTSHNRLEEMVSTSTMLYLYTKKIKIKKDVIIIYTP